MTDWRDDPDAVSFWPRWLSIERIMMATVLVFQVATAWQRQQLTADRLGERLSAVELRVQTNERFRDSHPDSEASIYMRRDVVEGRLVAIEKRLEAIERGVDGLRR